MSNSVRKEKKKLIIDIAIIVIIAIVTFFIVFILTSKKETVTVQTTTTEQDKNDSISCHIGKAIENQFFDFKNVRTVSQEIKATFTNDKLSKLFYSYTGEYESNKDAESASSFLTAQFNKHLGEHGVPLKNVSHTIYSIDSNVRVDLYAETKNINLYTGKLFLLDSNEFNTAKTLAPKTFEKLYKNKGFTCENVQ